jgi:hypothetical protein
VPRQREPNEMIGCSQAVQHAREWHSLQSDREPQRFRRPPCVDARREIERSPNPPNVELVSDAGNSAQDRRREMCMFMRIQMRRANTSCLDLVHLGGEFFINRQLPARQSAQQFRNSRRQRAAGESFAADQRKMTTDIQRRIAARQLHRMLECFAIRHQRRRSQNSGAMRLYNTVVHVARETEIVGIYSQTNQNSASLIRRNFFGFACMSFTRDCASVVSPFSDL